MALSKRRAMETSLDDLLDLLTSDVEDEFALTIDSEEAGWTVTAALFGGETKISNEEPAETIGEALEVTYEAVHTYLKSF